MESRQGAMGGLRAAPGEGGSKLKPSVQHPSAEKVLLRPRLPCRGTYRKGRQKKSRAFRTRDWDARM